MIDPVAYDRWLTTPPESDASPWSAMLASKAEDAAVALENLALNDPEACAKLLLSLDVITKTEADFDSWEQERIEGEREAAADDRGHREREGD